MFIDKEMRNMIREFKKTQPHGVRNQVQRQMRAAYEGADPELKAQMKEQLRAHLNGELPANVTDDLAVPIHEYVPTRGLMEQGSINPSRGSDSQPEASGGGNGV